MPTFLYPTSAELMEIEQSLLPDLTEDDPLFSILPIEDLDADTVLWEQEDNWYGLQQVRGLNGDARRVNRTGMKRYRLEPGYYTDFVEIDEAELVRRRSAGSFNQPIDINDLVRKEQDRLLMRRLARIKYIGWTLLSTGTFSVALPGGGTAHTDTFSLQTFSSSVPWATAATATPLADFRAVKLLARGYSVDFGASAVAFMNETTWQYLIKNLNASDLYGRRTQGLGTYENVQGVNSLLAGDNLPQIVVYDRTYQDDSNVTQLFIPNNKVVVVGQRLDKQPLGAYVMTRNANNPSFAPGAFTTVVDSAEHGEPIPHKIKVFDSHNGGPRISYPSAVTVMTVS